MTAQGEVRKVDSEALLLASPEEGYFMMHGGNIWQRIIIHDPLKGPGPSG